MSIRLINAQVWFCLNGKWMGLIYKFNLNYGFDLSNTQPNPTNECKTWVF